MLAKTGTFEDESGDGLAQAGETITYAFVVANTGNVTLTNVTIADTIGGVTVTGGPIAVLPVGAFDDSTFTGTYTLTQADVDAGTFTNVATATGTPPSGPDVTDPDDDTQTFDSDPSILLAKTGTVNDGGDGVNPGDTITYTFTVTNTGGVTLTNVTIADTIGGVTISGGPIPSLAPGIQQHHLHRHLHHHTRRHRRRKLHQHGDRDRHTAERTRHHRPRRRHPNLRLRPVDRVGEDRNAAGRWRRREPG